MLNAADHDEEIAFGAFRLDMRGRTLRRDGISVPMGRAASIFSAFWARCAAIWSHATS